MGVKVAIIGTCGIPARYGGFETLAEQLTKNINARQLDFDITIYCDRKCSRSPSARLDKVNYFYSRLSANGVSSIIYDIRCMLHAAKKSDVLLILGVSGCIALPIINYLYDVRTIVNVDGLEWKRKKWGIIARQFLKFSEKVAVRSANAIVADNQCIATYLRASFNKTVDVIAYGGDQNDTTKALPRLFNHFDNYALSICRIEPENNVEMILEACSSVSNLTLVFVGNWEASKYGRKLFHKFSGNPGFYLLNPIYDQATLAGLRSNATMYLHGHSAGGTNPTLVEAMFFENVIFAYDCEFNRETTKNSVKFFRSHKDLALGIHQVLVRSIGGAAETKQHVNLAMQRYTWTEISRKYCEVIDRVATR